MNRTEIEEKLRDTLRNLDSEELLCVWNEYTDQANYPDDRIYPMEELDEIYSGTEATEVLRRAFKEHIYATLNQENNSVDVCGHISTVKYGHCPKCNEGLNSEVYPHWCGYCGQAVKWE